MSITGKILAFQVAKAGCMLYSTAQEDDVKGETENILINFKKDEEKKRVKLSRAFWEESKKVFGYSFFFGVPPKA